MKCVHCGHRIKLNDKGKWDNSILLGDQCWAYDNPVFHGPHIPEENKENLFDRLYIKMTKK